MRAGTRSRSAAVIAGAVLVLGLAGCSALPTEGSTSGSVGVACLTLRSTVTNIEALRVWCTDHDDPAGASGWLTGIASALKNEASTDARVREAVTRLDAQVEALSGDDRETVMAQLPEVLSDIADSLQPVRDAGCA